MTCQRARALVETSTFMGRPQAEMDAAWRHAQGCEACRAALALDAVFTDDLRALASPIAAPDLAAVVMAEIERAPSRSVVGAPQSTDAASWWLLVASALAIGVTLAIWGPQALEDLMAQLPASVRPEGARDALQPAFALISIGLYLALMLMPLLTRREAR